MDRLPMFGLRVGVSRVMGKSRNVSLLETRVIGRRRDVSLTRIMRKSVRRQSAGKARVAHTRGSDGGHSRALSLPQIFLTQTTQLICVIFCTKEVAPSALSVDRHRAILYPVIPEKKKVSNRERSPRFEVVSNSMSDETKTVNNKELFARSPNENTFIYEENVFLLRLFPPNRCLSSSSAVIPVNFSHFALIPKYFSQTFPLCLI